uniref:Gustatory receptor n=1 Tax=Phlebotomus papatasi TaxID=29031 RepID=A0A3F2ZER3_PHLPP
SNFKIFYSITIFSVNCLIRPGITAFLLNNISKISNSDLVKLVCIVQTQSQIWLNVFLMFHKLLNYRKDILCRNNYEKLKEIFNEFTNNGIMTELKIRYYRNILLTISLIVLFFFPLVTITSVIIRVMRFRSEGFYYVICYIFLFSQIFLSGENFFRTILKYKFMISQINRTLETYLETLTYEIKYKSKAHCEIVSCKMSDNLNKLQELNSSIYSLIAELMQYESFSMIIVFLHKFVEIIISLFYQFVAQLLCVVEFCNDPHFIIFGICYASCHATVMSTTAKILHEFPVHKTDDRLKESINRFSLQILQEKRPISVCGMFNVDNTLLYSMISSMTSYLILLVQFQLQGVGSSKG